MSFSLASQSCANPLWKTTGCSGKQVLTFSLGVGSGEEWQEPAWRNLQQEHRVQHLLEWNFKRQVTNNTPSRLKKGSSTIWGRGNWNAFAFLEVGCCNGTTSIKTDDISLQFCQLYHFAEPLKKQFKSIATSADSGGRGRGWGQSKVI